MLHHRVESKKHCKKQKLNTLKVELQFLVHQKNQYLDTHRELSNDFTTWELATWHLLDFSNITFPQDPHINISKVRSQLAVAMILWYEPDIRFTQDRLWQELNFAWKAKLHSDLGPASLETWPKDGPHDFIENESRWHTETLRSFKLPQRGAWPSGIASASRPRARSCSASTRAAATDWYGVQARPRWSKKPRGSAATAIL
jgi:hypothetical protein